MKAEHLNAIVEASKSILRSITGLEPERGELSARPQMFTTQQVNVVCGVAGEIEGLLIIGMSVATADKIASKMLGAAIVTFDQLAASAIAELANIISGHSVTQLSGLGFRCDITPPTIIRGSKVHISTLDIPAIVIPLKVEGFGHVEVNVSLKERNRAAA